MSGDRSRKPQSRRLIPCAARRAWTVYSCSRRKGRLSRSGPGNLEPEPRRGSLNGSWSGKAKQTPRSSYPERGRVEKRIVGIHMRKPLVGRGAFAASASENRPTSDLRCRPGGMSLNGMVRPCSCPTSNRMLGRGAKDKEHAMSQKFESASAVIGIDIGKNSFHVVAHDVRGAIVLRQNWPHGQREARPANIPHCSIAL